MQPTISVIVPTREEATTIARTLADLRSAAPLELILVDGGSRDATLERARPLVDRVVVEHGGLAAQLNRGALASCGQILLFAYADTLLPPGWPELVTRSLSRDTVVAGAFRLGFDSPRPTFRFLAAAGNLRNRLGLGPFGDQALYVRRDTFFDIGMYRGDAFLEDLELVRRLRRRGAFEILPLAVRTSTRRWDDAGFVRTLLLHWGVTAAYLLGKRRNTPGAVRLTAFLRTRRGRPSPAEGISVERRTRNVE